MSQDLLHGSTLSDEAAQSGALRYGAALYSNRHLRYAAEREFQAFKGMQREVKRKRDKANAEKRKRDEASAKEEEKRKKEEAGAKRKEKGDKDGVAKRGKKARQGSN